MAPLSPRTRHLPLPSLPGQVCGCVGENRRRRSTICRRRNVLESHSGAVIEIGPVPDAVHSYSHSRGQRRRSPPHAHLPTYNPYPRIGHGETVILQLSDATVEVGARGLIVTAGVVDKVKAPTGSGDHSGARNLAAGIER